MWRSRWTWYSIALAGVMGWLTTLVIGNVMAQVMSGVVLGMTMGQVGYHLRMRDQDQAQDDT